MRATISISDVLRVIGDFPTEGCADGDVKGIASLELALPGDLSFLGNDKYRRLVPESDASVILLPGAYEGSPKSGQLFIRVDNPSHTLTVICKSIESQFYEVPPAGIHETAYVHPSAQVSAQASVGPFVFIGEGTSIDKGVALAEHVSVGKHVTIGKDCHVRARVVVGDYSELGDGVILQPGVIIGSDGYGYDFVDGKHQKAPHIGKVVLEDNVEIGANTTIDRSRFEQTRIGEGTKIDNLVQIAHNVKIGKHCLIVAQAGISGSTVIEDGAIIGGQAGVAGHLHIGAGAKIAGQAAITKDVEPGAYMKGSPAMPYMLAQRIAVLQKRLPELFKRFARGEPPA